MTSNTTAIVGSRSRASAVHPVIRTRTAVAAALMFGAVLLGAALGLGLGTTALALYALALPVPMCLIWLSADVMRADER
ncbi:MAG: hypothetical protein KF782_33170 [Labilithrix sp.]|nr:hypothetical protein [Labilithrix sp.]